MSSFFSRSRVEVGRIAKQTATSLAELAGTVMYAADEPDGMLGDVENTANRVEALGQALEIIQGKGSRSPVKVPDSGSPRQRVETGLFQLSAAVEALANEIGTAGDLRDDDLAKLHKGFSSLADTVKLLKLDWTQRLSA